eukprot:TRINITY_DN25165_c0_g1_i1.p1 TRINITY_DN25165_c0_g1~~TRINITY_DN25165_c0_g1_i1.p1  ORF type:complete len:969 (+),score=101.55 TRINITY_DN25165_c0_g1_i1:30-2936(+)
MANKLYQNERFFVGRGWVATSPGFFFKSDPTQWTTTSGGIADAPSANAGWSITRGKRTDTDGWVYASSFDEFLAGKFSAYRKTLDVVRRRCWSDQVAPPLTSLLQHERYIVGRGWVASAPNMVFSGDPYEWTSKAGEAAKAPLHSEGWFVVPGVRTDPAGWKYASNFDDLLRPDKCQPYRRPLDMVRSREWSKNAQAPCTELVQNERFIVGRSWVASAPNMLFSSDPFEWTTADGVTAAAPSSKKNWSVVPGVGTDVEGWTYGTSFDNLASQERGQAYARPVDIVRRRVWSCVARKPNTELLQHQRFVVGSGWVASAPNLLYSADPLEWTTKSYETTIPPASEDWSVYLGVHTDVSGWQYASSFDDFSMYPSGGRRFMQPTDVVRRRLWKSEARPRITHLLQHQRFVPGRDWVPSAPNVLFCYDPYEWTTTSNETAQAPSATEDWLVVQSEGADSEGWEYASSFDVLDSDREGGRGCARNTDMVRRRYWVLREVVADLRSEVTGKCVQATSPTMLAAAMRERQERKENALCDLVATLGNAMSKRSMFRKLSLLSIVGWARVLKKHEEEYSALIAELPAPDSVQFESSGDMLRIRGILFALPYAKAVYGYPMLKGHMNSIGAALKGKVAGFDALETPDAKTNIAAMCEIAGRCADDVLHAHFDVSPLRPAHAVLVDHDAAAIVLAIRGTLCPEDAMTDAMGSAVSDDEVCGSSSFHVGILQAARWIAQQVRSTLEDAAKQYPAYRLVVAGHSLGAGVGAILALSLDQGAWLDAGDALPSVEEFISGEETPKKLRAGFCRVECYAFACPSIASLEVSTSERAQRVVTAVACGRDAIVRTCAENIDAMLHEVSMNSEQTQVIDAVGALIGGKAQTYATERKARNAQDVTVPQHYTVGRCFLIADPQSSSASLQLAKPEQLSKILLNTRMLSDHMLSQYEAGLRTACAKLGLQVELPRTLEGSNAERDPGVT